MRGLWLGFLSVCAALCASAREWRVVGSDLLGLEFPRAVRSFAEQAGAEISLELKGTRPALEALKRGTADVALVLLPPGELPPAEPFVARVIGFQAVFVIATEGTRLTQITLGQLRGLYGTNAAESITTWGELGLNGPERTRAVDVRAVGPTSALTLPLIRRLLLRDAEVKPTIVLADSPEALLAGLRQTDLAVGISPVAPVPGERVRALAVAASRSEPAFLPTPENLQQGDYTLRLPLCVVFRREVAAEVFPLVRFILSEDCAPSFAAGNIVPLPLGARNQLVFEFEELH